MIGYAMQLYSDHSPVQILDMDTFGVVFNSSSPMRVAVHDEKRATRFQVENGEERSDHIVENAIEIAIEFVLHGHDAKSQFQAMEQAYRENRLLTIQTRMRTYENMLIEAFPHEETVTVSDGAVLPLRFIEWREVQAEFGEFAPEQVADQNQTSTVDRGAQTGSPASETETERGSSIMGRWGLI